MANDNHRRRKGSFLPEISGRRNHRHAQIVPEQKTLQM
jgi:hypothetical protein